MTGQYLGKRQKSRTEQRETVEQARFNTGEVYVLETRNTKETTRVVAGEKTGDLSLSQEDDLDSDGAAEEISELGAGSGC